MTRRRIAVAVLAPFAFAALALAAATIGSLAPLPPTLDLPAVRADDAAAPARTLPVRIVDRRGEPLNTSYAGEWNVHDRAALHEIPRFLREAFVAAEDRRFYTHRGVDWLARLAALATNVAHLDTVRGASTITEQVVRMIHPRPRTIWSRWVEGFDAMRLERRFSKAEILEFYLNQVPYASNRRGVVQAARHYFARDLDTLSRREMLTLAVLVRAPSRLDPLRNAHAADAAVARLADRLIELDLLDPAERERVLDTPLEAAPPRLAVFAPHFVRHARREAERLGLDRPTVASTLDARLQSTVQRLLDRRIEHLSVRGAAHGAVLVADHATGEVLAWVVAGGGSETPATHIDTVLTPRQPGSALKPLLYALAFDSGLGAADIVVDAPLTEMMPGGLHSYRNYSGRFYGPVTLRDALGNSLNIPAVKVLQRVGAARYLDTLRALGFDSLIEHPDFYGDGLALGNGEVSLLELVEAYAALARGGVYRPLRVLRDDPTPAAARPVFSPEAASIVADILSDAEARALEFGRDSVLAFPVQTAVKTGTSSDYRDAWAVGFDHRYVAGVWIGDLDHRPTDGVTGSTGPALVLRAVFAELARRTPSRPLYVSPKLARHTVCVPSPGTPGDGCVERQEWIVPADAAGLAAKSAEAAEARIDGGGADDAGFARIRFRQPTPGLRLAYDPRLPEDAQAFELRLDGVEPGDRVEWTIDGETHVGDGPSRLWPVRRGEHRVAARVLRDGVPIADVGEVTFVVK